MTLKDDLLNCALKCSWWEITNHLKSLGKRPFQSLILKEALESFSHSQQNMFWKSASEFVTLQLFQEGENEHMSNAEIKNSDVFNSIFLMATLQVDLFSSSKDSIPENLIQLVVFTGDILNTLDGSVQRVALNLCEKWISLSLDGYKEISSSTFLILIGESLHEKAAKQCVKKVWLLRHCLSLLGPNLGNHDDHPLNRSLLSCAEVPVYLSCEEGIKFLSLILAMPPLTKSYHQVVKSCLTRCSKAQAAKHAQVYFRTWRNSRGSLKKVIEEDCLQDLMYSTVHVNRDFILAANLFEFLSYIHKQNKHKITSSMLHTLYSPFLWRSLKVANDVVRLNASTILCEVFPLSDISLSKEENEDLLEQQYQAFVTLLTDPSHLVRIAVIKGVFKILSNFWLVIPSRIIQEFFNIFLSKLVCDASSSEVRSQVVKGVGQLLEVTEAAQFIDNVLPHIAVSFDDVNASVRLSCIKLLQKVNLFNNTKFWDLVPFEHLLHSICEDIATRPTIIQLIQDVFFPLHLGEKEMLRSCIKLLEMNREAARWFYQEVVRKLDIETTTRFILVIWRAISKYVYLNNGVSPHPSTSSGCISGDSESARSPQANVHSSRKSKKKKKAPKRPNNENKAPDMSSADSSKEENSKDEEPNKMPLDNPEVILGLLDTIVVLWTGKFHIVSLPENIKYNEGLQTGLSKTYRIVWDFFKESPEISKTLIYLASFLPSKIVPTIAGLCTSRLRSFCDPQLPNDSFACFLNALCNWNRVDDIISIISEWIERTFNSVKGKSTKQKTVKIHFQENPPNPLLALRFLKHLLQHPLNKISLLQKNRHIMLQLLETLACIKDLLNERVQRGRQLSSLCSDEFLIACWKHYLAVASLLHLNEGQRDLAHVRNRKENALGPSTIAHRPFDSLRLFNECHEWSKKALLFMGSQDSSKHVEGSGFISQLLSVFLNATTALIAIGVADLPYLFATLNFAEEVLESCMFLPSLMCNCAHLIIESHKYLSVYTNDRLQEDPSSSCTYKTTYALLNVLSRQKSECFHEEESDIITSLESLLLVMSRSKLLSNKLSEDMLTLTLIGICKQLKLNDSSSLPECKSIKQMKSVPRILVSSIHKQTHLIEGFVSAIQARVLEAKFDSCEILAALLLLSALEKDGGKLSHTSWRNSVLAIESLNNFPSMNQNENSNLDEEEEGNDGPFFRFCSETSKDLIEILKKNFKA